MTARTQGPSSDPKHRSEDVVDYHFNDMTPEARAEFEKHLSACYGCRKALKTAGLLFPTLPIVLAVPKRKTTDELLEMMAAEEQRLRAEDRKQLRAKVAIAMRWVAPFVVAAAAAATGAGPAVQAVQYVAAKVSHHDGPDTQMAAPPKPASEKQDKR
jgi:predicted anti-sigma-YlaC factor YlaD